MLLSDYLSFFPSIIASKTCKPSPECEILCDDVIDGRYQVVVVRHSRHKCLEVVVVSKETGNEAPRLYLSSKKNIQLLTNISKDVKWQAMTYGIRKSIIDWLLVDFILSRLTIEEYGRKRVFFVDILLRPVDMHDQSSSKRSQVLPLQTSSSLSINKPSDLCPFNFKLHCLQRGSRKGSNLLLTAAAGSSTAAAQRWRYAMRRVLFNNLKTKIIHRLLSSSSVLSSSSQEPLFSGRSFDTCDSSIVDSPVRVKPTTPDENDSSVNQQRMKSNNNNSTNRSSRSNKDEVFFSVSFFRYIFY